ncbi:MULTISPECIES: aldose 1-epimerase [Rhodanobacter]|uniref:aldose 1-epimerase n=1 Tax=Rhodanobacter TaxID=75309 RepID=UPI00041B536B|nr:MULTISPECIES: aldose epimerase [Rhodanobacter]KZC18549.1 aldose epimerase [Rhodanobacter denitrificans]UJJ50820.1 aldose epimerase [Rhodanobacter denitrificans]UJM93535.1 aldose epimerase [Rhodanobacter denitrificans]UJM97066.1 aldose epimerase [Rhodanobacter denitrificans]UJN20106.1 aldose epimerase [Rhodanobacter denitrificans]
MAVMRYTARPGRLGDQDIVVLTDVDGGRCIRVARRGAALLSFEADVDGVSRDLAGGYADAAEIAARPGSRFAVMVPFAGRIADARYTFDGQVQDLAPGVTGVDRGSRHGFVRDADFELAGLEADDDSARVTLRTDAIRPRPGYPHAIDLSVTFVLDYAGLSLEACMRNVGDRAAPCFFGWHPYFRVADGEVDGWELQIPAQTLIRTGADLIALAGAEAYVALDDAPALDFREPRRIGDSIIDQGYTDLEADPDGRIRTRLRDPASGFGIAVWQEHGVMHAFTGDTVSRDPRRAVALEPMECMADAFNRPECAAAVRLEPGAERRFRCGLEIDS